MRYQLQIDNKNIRNAY